MKNIETWLPVFPGFYNTIFEPYEGDEIYSINQDREDNNLIGEIEYDHCKFDYEQYNEDIAESCTDTVCSHLKDLDIVTDIKYQNIQSPKYYNFTNDSINIEVSLSSENIKAIKKYLIDNIELYKEYIKESYTSYDGFISHYSNDVSDWLNDDNLEHKHELGAILNFICLGTELTDEHLYEFCECYLSLKNWSDVNERHICSECNELIIDDKEQIKQIEQYKKLTGKIPSEIKCNDCINLNE